MSQDPASFLIVHRDESGKPDSVYPCHGRVHACVVVSINVCRAMLNYPKIRGALVSFAREFNRTNPNAWYKDPGRYETTEEVVFAFIKAILSSFPTVYVDDSINSPGYLGTHVRHKWDSHFELRNQSILLNGSRVRDMIAAATRALHTGDNKHYDNQQYRTFTFMFANTLLHEIGHILVTFLTKDGARTSIRMGALVEGYSKDMGEAGRNLETIIFGGTLEFYHDHTHDDSQTGVPHIRTFQGARRVSQESIDATVGYHIHSPYHLEGPFLSPLGMRALGDPQQHVNFTDPMEWIKRDEIRRLGRTVFVGPNSFLAQLPFYPDFRAQAA